MNYPKGPAGRRKNKVGAYQRRGLKAEVQVPVNIEKALLLAAEDRSFLNALLDDRQLALEESGIRLTESEKAILNALPETMIQTLVSRLKPSTQRNRKFVRNVAAATVIGGMIIATATAGCDSQTKGCDPDDYQDSDSEAGAGPDSGD